MAETWWNAPSAVLPVSKEDFVYETLRELILSGQLKPNESISQVDIAGKLGVSPIPVRAAMGRLVAEGLMTQKPHYSPQVSALSLQDLEEILTIRAHLEVLATKVTTPFIGPETAAELRLLLDEMSTAIEDRVPHRYGSLNKAFHLKIYEHCPYPLLQQMIKDLWDKADLYRSRSIFTLVLGLTDQSQREHEELLQLMQAGEAELAAKLLERHKARAQRLLLEAASDSASQGT